MKHGRGISGNRSTKDISQRKTIILELKQISESYCGKCDRLFKRNVTSSLEDEKRTMQFEMDATSSHHNAIGIKIYHR